MKYLLPFFFFLNGCSDTFINKDPEILVFEYKEKKIKSLYLYRAKDQEIGFKNNPQNLPIIFTWTKPIDICFTMKGIGTDLYIYYFNEHKELIEKQLMRSNSDMQYCPPKKILYAVESNYEL